MKKSILVHGLLLLMVGAAALPLSGQQLSNYEGRYFLSDSVKGIAAYDFFISSGDTVKNGNFEFRRTRPDSSERDSLKSIEYEGFYSRNRKHKGWQYRLKKLTPVSTPEINGHKVSYPASGSEYLIDAHFDNGKAQGTWEAVLRNVLNSAVTDTASFARSTFDQGNIKGPFTGYSPVLNVQGQFTDNGFLNGTWVIKHESESGSDIEEFRIYQKGILKDHYFEIDNNKYHLHYAGIDTTHDDEDEIWDSLYVTDQYFTVIKASVFEETQEQKNGSGYNSELVTNLSERSNDYLESALYSFGRYDNKNVWQSLPGSDTADFAKVKLRKFPYQQDEKEQLKSIRKDLEQSGKIISAFFDDAQIDVSRHSFEQVTFYYEVLNVYKSYFQNLKKTTDQLSDPAFLYIDRKEVFPYIYSEFEFPEQIEYEFDEEEKSKKHTFPRPLNAEKDHIDELSRIAGSLLNDLQDIQEDVNNIVDKYKKEARLKKKEKKLVNKRDTVLSLYDTTNQTDYYNEHHRKTSQAVFHFVDQTFKSYASKDIEHRINVSDSLTRCFEDAVKLFETQKEIPAKTERLDELYTRTVWNPYTMTDMDERVKERVYSAYEKDLLPVILKEQARSLNCENISEKAERFNKLYSKMVHFRDKDTKDLEKDLKKASSVNEKMNLFELDQ